MSLSFEQLEVACTERGLTLTDKGNGHWQIFGGQYRVNIYPFAKRPKVYINGMNQGIGIRPTVEDILAYALSGAAIPTATKRRPQKYYRKVKAQMLRISDKCHWCEVTMMPNEVTLDHRIPLSKGGLDNPNNYVLAHERCNKIKADKLPHEAV